MESKRIVSHALIAAGMCVSFGSFAIADEWTIYVNPRFGTRAEVPAQGFTANPPPANGDGQSWTSMDGKGQLSVYGSFIVMAETFQGYRQYRLNSAREEFLDITYSAGKRDWFAYSGTQGRDIVYMKVVLSKNCSSTLVANHIYLKYPASQKKRYDPIVKRMAKSLRAGRGVYCD